MVGPQITLTFPARAEFLRLVRLTSADAGSRAGLDYEEIDDLKIAASEACSLVLGSEGPLTLVRDDELARALIVAVVDDYEITDGSGRTQFRMVKRRRDIPV